MKVFLVSLIFGDGDGYARFEAKGVASSKEKCLDIIKKEEEMYCNYLTCGGYVIEEFDLV